MSIQAMNLVLAKRFRSSAEKFVMVSLANHADEQWSCWPSQQLIAAETGLSDRSVRSNLLCLEGRGLIVRERRYRDNRRITDRIFLAAYRIADLPDSGAAVMPSLPPDVDTKPAGKAMANQARPLPEAGSGRAQTLPANDAGKPGHLPEVDDRSYRKQLPTEPSVEPSVEGLRNHGGSTARNMRELWDLRSVQTTVIDELERLTGKVVTSDHARREAKRLLDGRDVRTPQQYVRKALQDAAAAGRLHEHMPTPTPPNYRSERGQ